jgi:hypothetical protein
MRLRASGSTALTVELLPNTTFFCRQSSLPFFPVSMVILNVRTNLARVKGVVRMRVQKVKELTLIWDRGLHHSLLLLSSVTVE